MKKIITQPFHFCIDEYENGNQRYDLILRGVHHVGCSYEGRIFLNNSDADDTTGRSLENGYAGSYFVFGHGDCYGAPGHCGPPPVRLPYDTTPPPDSTPIEIHLDISEALENLSRSWNGFDVTLSIVPVVKGKAPDVFASPGEVGRIDGPISIVSYA